MPVPRLIADEAKFQSLWKSGLPAREIGRIFGVSHSAVCNTANRMGLQSRLPEGDGRRKMPPRKKPQTNDRKSVSEEAKERQLGRISRAREGGDLAGHAFWTAERDCKVFATQGRYAEIDQLSAKWNVPVQKVMARWHRLRVA